MRATSFILAAGALTLAFSSLTFAQDVPLHVAQPASHPAQEAAPQTDSGSSAQSSTPISNSPPVPPLSMTILNPTPLSLGEIARQARAEKANHAKSVKIFDDENMPRAPIDSGTKAPGFEAQNSSSGGKVTLLDFWASWCGPCRHALPGLKQLQAAYGADQVEVISISEDEDEETWQNFVAQNQMTWTQRLDANHQMMRQFGASALPTYVLIGKDGNVVQQYVGDDPQVPVIDRIGPDLKKSLEGKS
jgi:thiol-disulfide isomerase/thioredoxin